MDSKAPPEQLPLIGTVENPALFHDGTNLFLSYEIAPAAGGGIAILRFSHVLHFEKNPVNVEGLAAARYPVSPWNITEITGSDRTARWSALRPRFWTISFNDVTVEVVFTGMRIAQRTTAAASPATALLDFLQAKGRDEIAPD